MTMAALDAEVAASEGSATGVPLVSRSSFGVCDEQAPAEAKAGSGASDLQPADPKRRHACGAMQHLEIAHVAEVALGEAMIGV